VYQNISIAKHEQSQSLALLDVITKHKIGYIHSVLSV